MKRTRIAPVSDEKLERAEERRLLCARIWMAQGRRCALWWHPTPCSGPIDGHEVVRRWAYPDGAYDEAIIIMVCRTHHELDGQRLEAERLGLRVPEGIWAQHGYAAVAEQAARRAQWARRLEAPPDPTWW